jgi:alpha-beta hydrolase superfamily lysophospholipase
MGAVAILKAQHDYQLDIQKMIIEAPFGSLQDAVGSRFENMEIPQILLPEMLLFWGGMQTNMNAFEHDATVYAAKVKVPTLHIYGKKDPKVRLKETKAVFNALAGKRTLKILENCAHDHVMADDPSAWTSAIWSFMED